MSPVLLYLLHWLLFHCIPFRMMVLRTPYWSLYFLCMLFLGKFIHSHDLSLQCLPNLYQLLRVFSLPPDFYVQSTQPHVLNLKLSVDQSEIIFSTNVLFILCSLLGRREALPAIQWLKPKTWSSLSMCSSFSCLRHGVLSDPPPKCLPVQHTVATMVRATLLCPRQLQ